VAEGPGVLLKQVVARPPSAHDVVELLKTAGPETAAWVSRAMVWCRHAMKAHQRVTHSAAWWNLRQALGAFASGWHARGAIEAPSCSTAVPCHWRQRNPRSEVVGVDDRDHHGFCPGCGGRLE
jgi:hypothetical protein